MSVTTRAFSTGFFTSELAETHLLDLEERMLWLYLKYGPLTSLCGFYQLSLPTASAQTLVSLKRVAEIIAKLEQLQLVVYDRNYIFIPGFAEEQRAVSEDRDRQLWLGATEHIQKAHRTFPGDRENKAFKAFADRFETLIAKPPIDKKGRGRKKKSEEEQTTATTQGESHRTTSFGGHFVPPVGQNGETAHVRPPSFDEVKRVFMDWRMLDTKEPCPHASIVAEEFYRHYEKKGWPVDWPDKVTKWALNRLKDKETRTTNEGDGPRLAGGGRLAIG